jgi:hypothetical protein
MSHFTRISLGLFRIHKPDAPSYGACIIGDPGATVELREKRFPVTCGFQQRRAVELWLPTVMCRYLGGRCGGFPSRPKSDPGAGQPCRPTGELVRTLEFRHLLEGTYGQSLGFVTLSFMPGFAGGLISSIYPSQPAKPRRRGALPEPSPVHRSGRFQ